MKRVALLIILGVSAHAFAQAPTPPAADRCPPDGPDHLLSTDGKNRPPVAIAFGTVEAFEPATSCRPVGYCHPYPLLSLCATDFVGSGMYAHPLVLEIQFVPPVRSGSDYVPRRGDRLLITFSRLTSFADWSCGSLVSCEASPKEKFVVEAAFRPVTVSP